MVCIVPEQWYGETAGERRLVGRGGPAAAAQPPEAAAVTHTFVNVRQESRAGDPVRPYGPIIACREVVYHHGDWEWAFDLAAGDDALAEQLVLLVPLGLYNTGPGFTEYRAD